MSKTRMIKVLVVDNEKEFASTLAARLELYRIKAASAFSGTEALAAIALFRPDVVTLDMQMPDMSGLEVLSRIKAIDPGIEVIFLTGHGSLDIALTSMERGAFDYIIKPVDLSALLERITDAGSKRKNGMPPPSC